jgi:hypothetical protein
LPAAGVESLRLPVIEHFVALFEQQPVAFRRRLAHLRRQLRGMRFGEGEALATVEIGVIADEFAKSSGRPPPD